MTALRYFNFPGVAAFAAALLAGSTESDAIVLFSETFDNFDNVFNDPGNLDEKFYGLPLRGPDAADEIWYGARFEYPDNGAVSQDIGVQEIGGDGNYTPVGRFEDDAGLVFRIPAGFEDIHLSFDWRTFKAETNDRLVAGYFVGDLGFDLGANRLRDFYRDAPAHGSQNAAVAWWHDEWTELLRGTRSDRFTRESFVLPDTDGGEDLWVAFWMDNGEGDFGKIDNVLVTAEAVPEPATWGLVAGLAAIAVALIRRHRG